MKQKIYRAEQELRFLTKQNNGSDHNASGDRQQIKKQSEFVDGKFTLKQEKKMEEDLDFFFNNTASQAIKRKKKESLTRKKSNHPIRSK